MCLLVQVREVGKRSPKYEGAMVTSLFKILFIYLFLAVLGLGCCTRALVAVRGGYSSLRCAGFSLRWLPLLRSMGSRSTGFSSCGSQAQ